VRTIELTQGQVALVSDKDYPRLVRHKWFALKTRNGFYAARKRHSPIKSGRKTILMHRDILGLRSRRRQVDHKDHDGLNNQRRNIRACNHRQNQQNRKSNRLKGFIFNRTNGNYNARIHVNGKMIYLGVGETPEEAGRIYDKAAVKYFGRFANPNFREAAA
jgi:hypothetical protein